MKHILDRSFRYIPGYETDLRATFDRIRREQAGSNSQGASSSKPARKNVMPMPVRQEAKK